MAQSRSEESDTLHRVDENQVPSAAASVTSRELPSGSLQSPVTREVAPQVQSVTGQPVVQTSTVASSASSSGRKHLQHQQQGVSHFGAQLLRPEFQSAPSAASQPSAVGRSCPSTLASAVHASAAVPSVDAPYSCWLSPLSQCS